jgi:regulatory protein
LKRKGFAATLVSQTLRNLRRSRYAGDEHFARDWTRSRADGRGYGPLRIEQELRAKGIDESIILDALRETFGARDESERARLVLQKHFRRERFGDPKIVRRAAALLQRRGYSESVIENVLNMTKN